MASVGRIAHGAVSVTSSLSLWQRGCQQRGPSIFCFVASSFLEGAPPDSFYAPSHLGGPPFAGVPSRNHVP